MNHWLSRQGLLEEALQIHEAGEDLCLATLIEIKGSAPQDVGAKMIIPRSRAPVGTIGGGKFEAAVIKSAREMMEHSRSDKPILLSLNLQRDLGMSCGGEAKVLLEPVLAQFPLLLAVFGAGHVGQALVPLLGSLKAKVNWYDDRLEWLEKGPKSGSKLDKIQIESGEHLEKIIEELPENAFIVSVTKGHQFDLEVLRPVLRRNVFPYVGVIGSRVKALALRRQLQQEGFSERLIEQVRCPIGEDFGTNDPHEIAFSIVAQILRVRDKIQSDASALSSSSPQPKPESESLSAKTAFEPNL